MKKTDLRKYSKLAVDYTKLYDEGMLCGVNTVYTKCVPTPHIHLTNTGMLEIVAPVSDWLWERRESGWCAYVFIGGIKFFTLVKNINRPVLL